MNFNLRIREILMKYQSLRIKGINHLGFKARSKIIRIIWILMIIAIKNCRPYSIGRRLTILIIFIEISINRIHTESSRNSEARKNSRIIEIN